MNEVVLVREEGASTELVLEAAPGRGQGPKAPLLALPQPKGRSGVEEQVDIAAAGELGQLCVELCGDQHSPYKAGVNLVGRGIILENKMG